MVMRATLRELAEDAEYRVDPKTALLKAVGDLEGIEIFHNLVLVATYLTPPIMMKGAQGEAVTFHLPDRTQTEDRFQGKVALVLKTGPMAFKDDKVNQFGGVSVKEGDWVMVRPSDGLEFYKGAHANAAKGISCRLFEDANIKARIADPSVIY